MHKSYIKWFFEKLIDFNQIGDHFIVGKNAFNFHKQNALRDISHKYLGV